MEKLLTSGFRDISIH